MWVFIFLFFLFVCVLVRVFSVCFLLGFFLAFSCCGVFLGGFRFLLTIHLFSTSDI